MSQLRTWGALLVLAMTVTSCSSFDPGERKALDEEGLARVLPSMGFKVPPGFEFGQAYTYSEFVGEPARSARFDAPPEYGDGRAVSAANPSFPPMQSTTCDAVPPGSWTSLGFTCAPEILMIRHPPSGGLGSVTVLLTSDDRGSHLFIETVGH
ncbi:MAG: hypothetical protein GX542_11295 [Rhodococcus sp.]|nr:hypothetical protein [Rhodococcus sp. (in: high G+C Gram-positive bacteria)]